MELSSYFGNPWVGMFVKTNDQFTIIPVDTLPKLEDALSRALGTSIVRTTVAESNLHGVYMAMNSNGVILPNIATEREVEVFKKAGLNIHLSREKHNAHGNNIALNDKGGIINPNVAPPEAKLMADTLGVELVPMAIAEYTTVGSSCLVTNNGFLAHYKANEEELKTLASILKVPGNKGTINTGSGFAAYGVVVNKNGYVAGEGTTPHELGRLEEALGLIK